MGALNKAPLHKGMAQTTDRRQWPGQSKGHADLTTDCVMLDSERTAAHKCLMRTEENGRKSKRSHRREQ